jgi:hypothetical protein
MTLRSRPETRSALLTYRGLNGRIWTNEGLKSRLLALLFLLLLCVWIARCDVLWVAQVQARSKFYGAAAIMGASIHDNEYVKRRKNP